MKSSFQKESSTYDEKSFGRTVTVRSVEYLDPRIVLQRRLCVDDLFFRDLAIRHRFCSMMFVCLRNLGDVIRIQQQEGEDEKRKKKKDFYFLLYRESLDGDGLWVEVGTAT